MQKTQKHISVDFWRFLACFCPQVVGGFVLPSFEHQKYDFFLFATPGRKILLIRVATEKNNKDLYMPPSRPTCYIRPKCLSSRYKEVSGCSTLSPSAPASLVLADKHRTAAEAWAPVCPVLCCKLSANLPCLWIPLQPVHRPRYHPPPPRPDPFCPHQMNPLPVGPNENTTPIQPP